MGKTSRHPFVILLPARHLATLLTLMTLFTLSGCVLAHPAEQTIPPATLTPQAYSSIQTALPQSDLSVCAFHPLTAQLLKETDPEAWIGWVEKLSGAEPVIVNGKLSRITSRYSPAMFSGQPNAQAFEFVRQTVSEWYPSDQVTVMPYLGQDSEGHSSTWYNLSLTLPGTEYPDEYVILSAHLDSISSKNPAELAPGASDNGSGSAALLEAARLLRAYQFKRTIVIVWFTGEEQGLLGSQAFVKTFDYPQNIIGVVNLDMFGFDSDNDACFEIHAGTLSASETVGQCFVQSIKSYDLLLSRYDYLRENAIERSDHNSFWEVGIGAIEILENLLDQDLPQGCPNQDSNSSYHTSEDTVEKLNPVTGIAIVRAALATIAGMAELIDQAGYR